MQLGSSMTTSTGPTVPSWVVSDNGFSNTFEWVSEYFTKYMDELYYPALLPGYSVAQVNGIVQRQAPEGSASGPDANTYQWDVSYDYIGPGTSGTWEETFSFKVKEPYYTFANQPCRYAVSMGRQGTLAAGATGFTPLEEGQASDPDAVVVMSRQYFGATTELGLAAEIEKRGDKYYVIMYLPGDEENVYEVAGPFDTLASAAEIAQQHIDEYTVDIVNAELEEARDQAGEAGQTPSFTTPEGDLGTVSGQIPDYVPGFAYKPANAATWQEAIDQGVLVDYDITAAVKGKTLDLAGQPLFGYTSEGSYGFDQVVFTVASGYKLTFDLDCNDFEHAGETWFGMQRTADVDFELQVIMEGGDRFALYMGSREEPPVLSIILDGEEKTVYEYSDTATFGTIDRSAQLTLVKIEQQTSVLPEGTPTTPIPKNDGSGGVVYVPDIPGSSTGDVIGGDVFVNPTLPPTVGPGPGFDPVIPDPTPDPVDPSPDPDPDTDDDEESGLGGLALIAMAVLGIILLGMFAAGRSD